MTEFELPEITHLLATEYNPNNLDQLDFPDLDYKTLKR